MRITGYIDNEREVMRQLRNLNDGVLRDKVYRAMEEAGEQIAAEARMRAPKRTGKLALSIKIFGNKKALTVKVYAGYPDTGRNRKKRTQKQKAGSREYYAMAMEYGTKHVKAQPFLMPAGEAKSQQIMEDITKATESALNDTVGSV
jgi:HK97 gp10 family phage protein